MRGARTIANRGRSWEYAGQRAQDLVRAAVHFVVVRDQHHRGAAGFPHLLDGIAKRARLGRLAGIEDDDVGLLGAGHFPGLLEVARAHGAVTAAVELARQRERGAGIVVVNQNAGGGDHGECPAGASNSDETKPALVKKACTA